MERARNIITRIKLNPFLIFLFLELSIAHEMANNTKE